MGKITSFFSVKTQFENVGDALINRELIRLASAHGQAVVDVSRCPTEFQRTLALDGLPGVRVVHSTRRLFRDLIGARLAGHVAYYFLSPGGYFGDIHGLRKVSAWLNTLVLCALYIIGVRICQVGVSYERLGPGYLRLLRARARIMHRHLVRDEDSFKLLSRVGVRVDGTMPDLSVSAARGSTAAGPCPGHALALSFRVDQDEGQSEAIKRVVVMLDEELSADLPFKVVVQVKRDLSFARELVNDLAKAGNRPVSLIDCSDDIDRCIREYADCHIVLSNRLHALLIGAIAGVVPVAVTLPNVNGKIAALFRDCNLGQNVFDLGQPNGVDAVVAALKEGRAFAKIDLESLREQLLSCIRDLFDRGCRAVISQVAVPR